MPPPAYTIPIYRFVAGTGTGAVGGATPPTGHRWILKWGSVWSDDPPGGTITVSAPGPYILWYVDLASAGKWITAELGGTVEAGESISVDYADMTATTSMVITGWDLSTV